MMNLTITKITNFIGHKNALYQLHRISDQSFYSAGADGMLVRWDLSKPKEGLLVATTNQAIYSILQFKNYLLLGLKNGSIHVINTQTFKEERQLLISDNPIFSMATTEDLILIGTESGMLYQMDSNFQVTQKKKIAQNAIRSLHIAQGIIYAGSTDNHLYILNPEFDSIHAPIVHPDTIFSLTHTADELITGCKDARIRIFDLTTLALKKTLDAHWYHVKSLHSNPKHALILSTSMDKTIRIWDSDNWELLKVIDREKYESHSSSVNCGLWLSENTVISCSDDRSIQAFHVEIENT